MGISATEIDSCNRKNMTCIVFGQGLIGCCVTNLLSIRSGTATIHIDVDWSDVDSLLNASSSLDKYRNNSAIEIVWSAGQGGFIATSSEMEKELYVYEKAINHLNQKFEGLITVNLVSSAGGLYEGQRYIDEHTEVKPRRPYGFSKLRQEEFLQIEDIPHRIYRVASAYGSVGQKARVGLINAFLINAIIGRTTKIFAKADTFRDYVFNVDVARFIVDDMLYARSNRKTIVCSGRSVSIQTLVHMISHITRKKIKVNYVPNSGNDEDMVFSRSLVPPDLRVTSLEEGIRMVHTSQKFINIS